MGLASTMQKAAQTAFKAIGDIPVTCIFTSKGTPVYNPTTGAYTSTDVPYPGLSILFEDFSAKDISDAGGTILSSDMKSSIPNLSLAPTQKITDIITDSNSQKWTIENVMIDAAKALYIFQVRRSA